MNAHAQDNMAAEPTAASHDDTDVQDNPSRTIRLVAYPDGEGPANSNKTSSFKLRLIVFNVIYVPPKDPQLVLSVLRDLKRTACEFEEYSPEVPRHGYFVKLLAGSDGRPDRVVVVEGVMEQHLPLMSKLRELGEDSDEERKGDPVLYDGSRCFRELNHMRALGLLENRRVLYMESEEGMEIQGKLPDVMVGVVWETEAKLLIDRNQANFKPNKKFDIMA